MPNNRIFYACQAVGIAPHSGVGTTFTPVHGVQSIGLNTTFNLEQAFELGQISIYENIEGIPDIEVTLEKVLDGHPTIYGLATSGLDISVQDNQTLVARSKQRCNLVLGIYEDDKVASSGTPQQTVFMSGMYINNIAYSMPADGNFTESITLVGNHKEWMVGLTRDGSSGSLTFNTISLNGNDAPSGNQGHIYRRQHFDMSKTVIPSSILNSYGISNGATEGNNIHNTTKSPLVHIQSINLSVDLGREDILELGRRSPYFKVPNFPVEVTSEFEVIAISGDRVNAYENGDPKLWNDPRTSGNNTTQEKIVVALAGGLMTFDLGNKNRLSSVTFGGGDAGGGNASTTFSYSNFNDFTVSGALLAT